MKLDEAEVSRILNRIESLKQEKAILENKLKAHYLVFLKERQENYEICAPQVTPRNTQRKEKTPQAPKKLSIVDLIREAK